MAVLRPKWAIHAIWNLELRVTDEMKGGGREEVGKVFRTNKKDH